MASSSSRARSSSPFSYNHHHHHQKHSSSYSSTSSLINGPRTLIPRSCSSSATSFYNSGAPRSATPTRSLSESMYQGSRSCSSSFGGVSPVAFAAEDLMADPADAPRSGDSISVTIRFRPLSEREYQRGDEVTWYADGDKIMRNVYNPVTAYAFDKVFGQDTNSQEVYEVAAKPVVKAAMEGVNGMTHLLFEVLHTNLMKLC